MKHLTKDERNCQQYCVNGFIVGMFDDGLNPTVKDCRDSFDSYNWDGLTDEEIQTIIDRVRRFYEYRDVKTFLMVRLPYNRWMSSGNRDACEFTGHQWNYEDYIREEDSFVCETASNLFGIKIDEVEQMANQIINELGL